ncbi:hypothetical protein ABE504_11115 [Paenibacillus oryzisoli]
MTTVKSDRTYYVLDMAIRFIPAAAVKIWEQACRYLKKHLQPMRIG